MKNFSFKSIAIILPAFNEEKTIVSVINDFHRALPGSPIYVINNSSTDKTSYLASKAISRIKNKGRVINELTQGKGNAIRRALHDIDANIYLIADADLTYPASQALKLIKPIISDEYDLVIGDRFGFGHYLKENKRAFHIFGNSLIRFFFNK